MPGEDPQRGMVDPNPEVPAQALIGGVVMQQSGRDAPCVGSGHQLTGMQTTSVRHGDMQHYLHRMHRLLDEVEAEHSQVCCRVQALTQGQTASTFASGDIRHLSLQVSLFRGNRRSSVSRQATEPELIPSTLHDLPQALPQGCNAQSETGSCCSGGATGQALLEAAPAAADAGQASLPAMEPETADVSQAGPPEDQQQQQRDPLLPFVSTMQASPNGGAEGGSASVADISLVLHPALAAGGVPSPGAQAPQAAGSLIVEAVPAAVHAAEQHAAPGQGSLTAAPPAATAASSHDSAAPLGSSFEGFAVGLGQQGAPPASTAPSSLQQAESTSELPANQPEAEGAVEQAERPPAGCQGAPDRTAQAGPVPSPGPGTLQEQAAVSPPVNALRARHHDSSGVLLFSLSLACTILHLKQTLLWLLSLLLQASGGSCCSATAVQCTAGDHESSGHDLNMSDWYGFNPMASVTMDPALSEGSYMSEADQSYGDMVLMASPVRGASLHMSCTRQASNLTVRLSVRQVHRCDQKRNQLPTLGAAGPYQLGLAGASAGAVHTSAASFATPTKLSRASLRSNASPFRTPPPRRAAGAAGSPAPSPGPETDRRSALPGSETDTTGKLLPQARGGEQGAAAGPSSDLLEAFVVPVAAAESQGEASINADAAVLTAMGSLATIRESLASSEGSMAPVSARVRHQEQLSGSQAVPSPQEPAPGRAAAGAAGQPPAGPPGIRAAAGASPSAAGVLAGPPVLHARVRALAAEEAEVSSPHSPAGSPLLAHHGAGRPQLAPLADSFT